MADLFPLTPGQVEEVYGALQLHGNKHFPTRIKFLEVLNGYWNTELREHLQDIRLAKGLIAGRTTFEVFRDAIVAKWVRSRCPPGLSAGGLATDAISQPVMQATLKTFHFAGLKRAGFGSSTARELISISPDRQAPNASIHLRDELTFDQIYRYALDHAILKVRDLLAADDYDIVTRADQVWEPWFWAAAAAKAQPFPEGWGAALRLNLDPPTIHAHRLTPAAVADLIEAHFAEGGEAEFYCVGSPVGRYAVYVLAHHGVAVKAHAEFLAQLLKGVALDASDEDRRLSRVLIEQALFQHLAFAQIADVDVPGDRYVSVGISDTGVADVPVLALVLKEVPVPAPVGSPSPPDGRLRFRWVANKAAVKDGATAYRLGRLLHAAGAEVESTREFAVPADPTVSLEKDGIVQVPLKPAAAQPSTSASAALPRWLYLLRGRDSPRRLVSLDVAVPAAAGPSALDWLRKLVAGDDKVLEAADKEAEQLQRPPFVHSRVAQAGGGEAGRLSELGRHWFIGAAQPNIRDLLRHPDVDPRFTTTNQLRTSKSHVPGIAETLGICALRNHICEEFYDTVVGGGDYIDPQHVVLVADYMVHAGRPTPLTSGGFAEREISTNDEAYYDKAASRYAATASIGKGEPVSTIATSISLGLPIPQGTGLIVPTLLGGERPPPSSLPAAREGGEPAEREPAREPKVRRIFSITETRARGRETRAADEAQNKAINEVFSLLAPKAQPAPVPVPEEKPEKAAAVAAAPRAASPARPEPRGRAEPAAAPPAVTPMPAVSRRTLRALQLATIPL